MSFRRYVHPHVCFALVLGFLGLSWLVVILLDVLNVAGAGEWFISSASVLILDNSSRLDGAPSPFFHVWFQNGSPVEWVQWASLAITAGVGLWMGGRLSDHARYADVRPFWLLLGAGALLLLIEDTGDPRHAMEGFLSLLYPVLPAGFPIKPTFELLFYFPLLAALPVYALYRYYHKVHNIPYVAQYLWIGFGFYALTAVCSASSGIGNWYHLAGGFLLEFFSEQLLRDDLGLFSVVFFLMDSLVEESIELVGAAGLVSAAVAQYRAAFVVPGMAAAELHPGNEAVHGSEGGAAAQR